MANKSQGSVQSIDRLFDIIEELSLYPRGMFLTDLSKAVELHTSTTYRLVMSLVNHGYAQKDTESGKYRLTMKLYEIGTRAASGLNILAAARPYLDDLSEQCGEVVHLVVRDGDEILYMYRQDLAFNIVGMSSYVGLRNPMYCTGVGKAIMAFLPEEEAQRIWESKPLERFTPNTIMDFSAMRQELKKIRQNGYAIDDEEHELGIRCVAAPVLDYNMQPIAAISASGTVGKMDDGKLVQVAPMVMKAAHEISGLMGAGIGRE